MKHWWKSSFPVVALGVAFAAPATVSAAKPLPAFQEGSLQAAPRDSALVKLGFDKRFYKKGDRWSVAWSFKKRNWLLKMGNAAYKDKAVRFSKPAVVNYTVLGVERQRLGTGRRTIARIQAKWLDDNLGQTAKEAIITVDQNMNPVALRVSTRGQIGFQRRDLDTRHNLVGAGTIPFYLPKMTDPGVEKATPSELPAAFRGVKPVTRPGTTALALDVQRDEERIATSYWVVGKLYASYVVGPNVVGVLINSAGGR